MFSTEAIEMLAAILAPLVAAKMSPAHSTKRVYDVKEAAVYIGRTQNALRILVTRGKIRTMTADSRIMFDVRDLDRWIDANKS